MSSDFELRLEEIEDRLAALDGAEPTTHPTGSAPITLSQVHRETQFIWESVRAIRDEIAQIRASLNI